MEASRARALERWGSGPWRDGAAGSETTLRVSRRRHGGPACACVPLMLGASRVACGQHFSAFSEELE